MPIVQQGSINTTALLVPDLYVQIVPPQNLVLNGVPTDVIGVVGTASWGPVNQPVIVATMADYARNFGPVVARKHDIGTQVATAVQQGAQNFVVCASPTARNGLADADPGLVGRQLRDGADSRLYWVAGQSTRRHAGPRIRDRHLEAHHLASRPGSGGVRQHRRDRKPVLAEHGQCGQQRHFSSARPFAILHRPNGNELAERRRAVRDKLSVLQWKRRRLDGGFRRPGWLGRSTRSGASVAVSDFLPTPMTRHTGQSRRASGCPKGVYMILTSPAGQGIQSAVATKQSVGLDSYAAKLMFGDWLWWSDQVNGTVRLVSPQGFVAGRLANLSPEQSSLNKTTLRRRREPALRIAFLQPEHELFSGLVEIGGDVISG